MRLCRFEHNGHPQAAFYDETKLVPLQAAAEAYRKATGAALEIPASDNLLDFLPPAGDHYEAASKLSAWIAAGGKATVGKIAIAAEKAKLLVPNPRPNKLFLLAGNYAEHIEEGGGIATERAKTFPYVFMKPPTTTLTNPGAPVRIPGISPNHIDWELELGVFIGRGGKSIKEADALKHVAGYTVINDISDRQFRPNPGRTERAKDNFFDWLHGKWHDTACPCGPCIAAADAIADPQKLKMKLSVNGKVFQDASTAQQIFPVAAVIEFISSFVTLEPGDMISTGTPAGVGNTTGTYLKANDKIEAYISEIGMLVTPIEAE